METPVYHGQQATSPAPIGLMQTSLKDCMADDTASPTNVPGRTSGTAGGYVTKSGRTVTLTQRLDL